MLIYWSKLKYFVQCHSSHHFEWLFRQVPEVQYIFPQNKQKCDKKMDLTASNCNANS